MAQHIIFENINDYDSQEEHLSANSCTIIEEEDVSNLEDDEIVVGQEERFTPNDQHKVIYHVVEEVINPTDYPAIDQQLIEFTKLKYRDFFIRIFTDSIISHPRRFYFEPIVLLEQNSVAVQSHKLFQQDVVRFTIKMWNQELSSKVLHLLRSLPVLKSSEIHESDISVMPYEEVQLVYKSGSFDQSVKLVEDPTNYQRLSESLDFYLLCDSPSTAEKLAENLKEYPEFVLKKWDLALECRGLTTLSNPLEIPVFKFNVSILPILDNSPEAVERKVIAPVFSAKICTNPSSSKGTCFSYSELDFGTKKEHGEFDLSPGIFTVKTAGIYQFSFSGHVYIDAKNPVHKFVLRVCGKTQASYFIQSSTETNGVQPVFLSALLPLNIGAQVGVYLGAGRLYESGHYVTRFSGILFGY